MTFSGEVLTLLVLISLSIGGFAVFLMVTRAPRRDPAIADNKAAVALLTDHDQSIAKLKVAVHQVAAEQGRLGEALFGALQRVGLVRYDAFDDMGGHLSFSVALLDANGNGMVITSINGRQDTRCYAKPVENWISQHNLSTEEEDAIRRALATPLPEGADAPLAAQGRGRFGRPGA